MIRNSPIPERDPRYLTREEGNDIARRARAFAKGGGETAFYVKSWWEGTTQWARNRVAIARDARSINVSVTRIVRGQRASETTNQTDDVSLSGAIRTAESHLRLDGPTMAEDSIPVYVPKYKYAKTAIWSDVTAKQNAEAREQVARKLMDTAEAQGLQSAGSIEAVVGGDAYDRDRSPDLYYPVTRAECSLTVRDPKAGASGWAGLSSYDWARIDTEALVARAVEKCLQSRNPVAVEPGRWTVILEPQATFDFVSPIMMEFSRRSAEIPNTPFHLPGTQDETKLGLRVASERVTISHDMSDPNLGVVPFNLSGEPYASVTLIEKGILVNLTYERKYAIEKLREEHALLFSGAFRLHGGEATQEDMIKSTARGLLVTRFSDVRYDKQSTMATGVTRDGMWLIERGKITKAVKNFRFVESPIFSLNNIEQMGVAVPIYSKGRPAVVPTIKARDFNMIGLADAI